MAISSLLVSTDNIVEIDGLQDQSDSSYINDATVTVTLLDAGDNEVSGQSWPLTMSYVSGSNGKYRATLIDTLSLKANRRYLAKIEADGGSGRLRTWYHWMTAVRG